MPRIDLRDIENLTEDDHEEFVDRRQEKRLKEYKGIKKNNIYYDE